MIDLEEILRSGDADELKEAKIWLFQENMRLEQERKLLEQERKSLEEAKDKFNKERICFKEEMNVLNRRSVIERKRLKEENLFFEKKMAILQDGFRQLESDRKNLEHEKICFEKEREILSQNRPSMDYYDDIGSAVGLLFRNATNPLTLRKRYKDLMKIFHPDNIAGDAELVQMINKEFSRRKREEA